LSDSIHKIDQPVVVNASVLSEADFAGSACRDTFLTILNGVFERAQRMGVEFWRGEAFVSGKAAAMNAFGHDNVDAAHTGEVDKRLAFTQVLRAARDVDRDSRLLRGEHQFVQQVSADEAHRVVEVEPGFFEVLNQA
jgi:hypothetical protein